MIALPIRKCHARHAGSGPDHRRRPLPRCNPSFAYLPFLIPPSFQRAHYSYLSLSALEPECLITRHQEASRVSTIKTPKYNMTPYTVERTQCMDADIERTQHRYDRLSPCCRASLTSFIWQLWKWTLTPDSSHVIYPGFPAVTSQAEPQLCTRIKFSRAEPLQCGAPRCAYPSAAGTALLVSRCQLSFIASRTWCPLISIASHSQGAAGIKPVICGAIISSLRSRIQIQGSSANIPRRPPWTNSHILTPLYPSRASPVWCVSPRLCVTVAHSRFTVLLAVSQQTHRPR